MELQLKDKVIQTSKKSKMKTDTHLSYPFVIFVASFCLLTFNLNTAEFASQSPCPASNVVVLDAVPWMLVTHAANG